MTVGAQGDGPSIRIDETLKHGKSYKSKTFNNEVLTYKPEGEFKREEFDIENIEVYIL